MYPNFLEVQYPGKSRPSTFSDLPCQLCLLSSFSFQVVYSYMMARSHSQNLSLLVSFFLQAHHTTFKRLTLYYQDSVGLATIPSYYTLNKVLKKSVFFFTFLKFSRNLDLSFERLESNPMFMMSTGRSSHLECLAVQKRVYESV